MGGGHLPWPRILLQLLSTFCFPHDRNSPFRAAYTRSPFSHPLPTPPPFGSWNSKEKALKRYQRPLCYLNPFCPYLNSTSQQHRWLLFPYSSIFSVSSRGFLSSVSRFFLWCISHFFCLLWMCPPTPPLYPTSKGYLSPPGPFSPPLLCTT